MFGSNSKPFHHVVCKWGGSKLSIAATQKIYHWRPASLLQKVSSSWVEGFEKLTSPLWKGNCTPLSKFLALSTCGLDSFCTEWIQLDYFSVKKIRPDSRAGFIFYQESSERIWEKCGRIFSKWQESEPGFGLDGKKLFSWKGGSKKLPLITLCNWWLDWQPSFGQRPKRQPNFNFDLFALLIMKIMFHRQPHTTTSPELPFCIKLRFLFAAQKLKK